MDGLHQIIMSFAKIQSDIWTTVQHDEKTPNCKIVLKEVGGQYFPCIERLPGAEGNVPRCNLRALGHDIHLKLPTIGQLLLRNVPMEKEVNEVSEMITARQNVVRKENESLLTRIKDLTNAVEEEHKRRAERQRALLSARGASKSKLDEKQSSLQEERDACTALQAQNTALEAELARLKKKLEKNTL